MCRIQNPRQEVIQDLKEMVCSALDGFISDNKIGPSKIFFFRDGVSEGEYQKIRDEEIRAIDGQHHPRKFFTLLTYSSSGC